MNEMKSWLREAREESGLTAQRCAVAIHQPMEIYLQIEQRPGMINLNELRALVGLFGSQGRERVRGALAESLDFAGGSE